MVHNAPDAMHLETAQGVVVVSIFEVDDIQTLTAEQWAAYEPVTWTVILDAPAELERALGVLERALEVGLAAIPGLRTWSSGPTTPSPVVRAIASCAADVACIAELGPDDAPTWVLQARLGDDGGVELRGRGPGPRSAALATTLVAEPAGFFEGLQELLGLQPEPADEALEERLAELLAPVEPVAEPAPVADEPGARPPRKPRRELTRGQVTALSFVPVPGLPSLMQGDGAGFAIAMSAATVGSAIWVGAVGFGASSAGEHAALGATGTYVCSVAASQILGERSRRRASLAVLPTHGGAKVTWVASF